MNPPRYIETKFRHQLGEISPFLSLIDISSNELINNNSEIEISKLSKKYGHKRLAVDHIDFKKINFFVQLSHLAFIHSRSERFCEEFRNYQKILFDDHSSPNLNELDKLRKVIYYLHAQKNSTFEQNETVYSNYAGVIELKIADYYRKIRNIEFHGGVLDKSDYDIFSKTDLTQIKDKYNYIPNFADQLTIRDVILYSEAWQKIAVNLCRKLVDIDSVVKDLCKKYKDKTDNRRDSAISKKLRNDYLQEESEINIMRQLTKGWVA